MNESTSIDQQVQAALQQHQRGQLAAAETSYRQILRDHPDHAMALQLLGVLCIQTHRANDAITFIAKAIALQPGMADWFCNLGEAHRIVGDARQAIAAYREAIRLKPTLAVAHNNLGIALSDLGDVPAAIEAYEAALRLNPNYPDAYANLGSALNSAGRAEPAIVACDKAVALSPRHAAALNNLGVARASLGQWTAAIEVYRRALAINPNYAEAYGNLCNALYAIGDADGAVETGEKAVAMRPGANHLEWSLAMAILKSGDLRRGWRAYECRWNGKVESPAIGFGRPMWDGSPIDGKTILLYGEQGFGDTIQFCRYAPLVAERGARVILQCQGPLMELCASLDGVEAVVERDEPPPPFDEHCSLMTLPLVFGTDLDSVPGRVPYLKVNPNRLAPNPPNDALPRPFRIGLCWAGNPGHNHDQYRSIRLAALEPLMRLPGNFEFHALQNGPPIAQATEPGFERLILEEAELNQTFSHTAARIAALDLVITVDTSVAHLAGALAKPVWVLLAHPSEWRWLTKIETTPWYPTMRLFRQQTPGDWPEVIGRVVKAMDDLSRNPTRDV